MLVALPVNGGSFGEDAEPRGPQTAHARGVVFEQRVADLAQDRQVGDAARGERLHGHVQAPDQVKGEGERGVGDGVGAEGLVGAREAGAQVAQNDVGGEGGVEAVRRGEREGDASVGAGGVGHGDAAAHRHLDAVERRPARPKRVTSRTASRGAAIDTTHASSPSPPDGTCSAAPVTIT